ncbi:hypothetical protein JCM10449v2_004202 [Rhodotorula kratochvilovae]
MSLDAETFWFEVTDCLDSFVHCAAGYTALLEPAQRAHFTEWLDEHIRQTREVLDALKGAMAPKARTTALGWLEADRTRLQSAALNPTMDPRPSLTPPERFRTLVPSGILSTPAPRPAPRRRVSTQRTSAPEPRTRHPHGAPGAASSRTPGREEPKSARRERVSQSYRDHSYYVGAPLIALCAAWKGDIDALQQYLNAINAILTETTWRFTRDAERARVYGWLEENVERARDGTATQISELIPPGRFIHAVAVAYAMRNYHYTPPNVPHSFPSNDLVPHGQHDTYDAQSYANHDWELMRQAQAGIPLTGHNPQASFQLPFHPAHYQHLDALPTLADNVPPAHLPATPILPPAPRPHTRTLHHPRGDDDDDTAHDLRALAHAHRRLGRRQARQYGTTARAFHAGAAFA